jgi:hypothetical protein
MSKQSAYGETVTMSWWGGDYQCYVIEVDNRIVSTVVDRATAIELFEAV